MDIEVSRQDLHRVAVREPEGVALAGDEARVRVDAFALTSNNITYAVFGDAMQYWDFFPPRVDPSADAAANGPEWGRIPVWGFGTVVETAGPDLVAGERLYGYFPMSSELVIQPGRADDRGVTDLSAHRRPMAGAYNRYTRVATDPIHRDGREDHQMLLYPLFFTSFVIDDVIDDNDGYGAEQVIISSASSKTAIGAAFLLRGRSGRHPVGLTSATHRGFVEDLDVYDDVRTYDEIESLGAAPSVYVDIAGNADVRHGVHTHLADSLRASMTVGDTHWDHEGAAAAPLPGPHPEFLFAPTQIAKRTADWGRDELDARVGDAWHRYVDWCQGWIAFQHLEGSDAVVRAYLDLLDGRTDPRAGLICSLRPTP